VPCCFARRCLSEGGIRFRKYIEILVLWWEHLLDSSAYMSNIFDMSKKCIDKDIPLSPVWTQLRPLSLPASWPAELLTEAFRWNQTPKKTDKSDTTLVLEPDDANSTPLSKAFTANEKIWEHNSLLLQWNHFEGNKKGPVLPFRFNSMIFSAFKNRDAPCAIRYSWSSISTGTCAAWVTWGLL